MLSSAKAAPDRSGYRGCASLPGRPSLDHKFGETENSTKMKTRILIIDHQQTARQHIKSLLAQHKSANDFDLAEASNGVDAMDLIKNFKPDIGLIEVNAPEVLKPEFLNEILSRIHVVIFQTTRADFALKAFDLNAHDFLLKPYANERFDRALKKALMHLDRMTRLAQLETEFLKRRQYIRRFSVKIGQRTKIIDEEDILCFTSKEHVTQVHLEGITYAYQHSLTYIEERTDPDNFLRVHKNAVVKISATVSYSKSRPMYVTLRNGDQIRVAQEREKKVRDTLDSKRKI
jgi:two-component system LytT family response regulator